MTEKGHRVDADAAKSCAGCKIEKPRSEFYRHKGRSDGLCSRCKSCTSADHKRRYAENPEPHIARAKARYAADVEKARRWHRENYKRNADALKEYQKRYRSENKDKIKLRDAAYYHRTTDKRRAWYAAYSASHRDVIRRCGERYRKKHPEMSRLKEARRKAAMRRSQVCSITKSSLMQRIEACGGVCVYCGATWEHIDHVKPIAKGGPHILSNLRPACANCNRRKRDRSPLEWFATVRRAAALPLP